MNETIIRTLEKHMSSGSAEHQISVITKRVRSREWFEPFNGADRLFDICREWADMGLMCRKTIPFWKNGHVQGVRTEFYFDPELDYSTTII